VLTLPHGIRIYLARGPTDMRKAIDGLAALTKSSLDCDPCSGHLFVFCNRRRNRLKILYWEESGFWMLLKRLERGTFSWPAADSKQRVLVMTHSELAALLGGLDFRAARRRRRFSPRNREIVKPRRTAVP